MEKMTREENLELCNDVIAPVIKIIDEAVKKYDADKLKATLQAMEEQAGFTQAWPFQETMDKGKVMEIQNQMFETIIKLIELRRDQQQLVNEQHKNKTNHFGLLRNLGAI